MDYFNDFMKYPGKGKKYSNIVIGNRVMTKDGNNNCDVFMHCFVLEVMMRHVLFKLVVIFVKLRIIKIYFDVFGSTTNNHK